VSHVRDRLGRVDHRIIDAILAILALVALELTVWLTSGTSASDRIVTAAAAVLYAAPIAVRRVWPVAAVVFSIAVVTVSMPFGSQLLSNDNAYVIPGAPSRVLRRRGARHAAEHSRARPRARTAVDVGDPARTGWVDQ
jgi:hypothetical protein